MYCIITDQPDHRYRQDQPYNKQLGVRSVLALMINDSCDQLLFNFLFCEYCVLVKSQQIVLISNFISQRFLDKQSWKCLTTTPSIWGPLLKSYFLWGAVMIKMYPPKIDRLGLNTSNCFEHGIGSFVVRDESEQRGPTFSKGSKYYISYLKYLDHWSTFYGAEPHHPHPHYWF